MTCVLVLRPEPGASATVRRARERNLDAVAIPLFEVEPVAWQAPDPAAFDALLLTSSNAVRFGGRELDTLRNLNVYAVGEATASAARNAGFTVAAIGEQGVEQLLETMPAWLRLLHLCGADRKEFATAELVITRLTIYRSNPIEEVDLSSAAGCVALIHSPRTGRRFAEIVRDKHSIIIAAISPAAAEAVGEGWRKVMSADRPNDEALLALAASLCNNSPPE